MMHIFREEILRNMRSEAKGLFLKGKMSNGWEDVEDKVS